MKQKIFVLGLMLSVSCAARGAELETAARDAAGVAEKNAASASQQRARDVLKAGIIPHELGREALDEFTAIDMRIERGLKERTQEIQENIEEVQKSLNFLTKEKGIRVMRQFKELTKELVEDYQNELKYGSELANMYRKISYYTVIIDDIDKGNAVRKNALTDLYNEAVQARTQLEQQLPEIGENYNKILANVEKDEALFHDEIDRVVRFVPAVQRRPIVPSAPSEKKLPSPSLSRSLPAAKPARPVSPQPAPAKEITTSG
jgi:hypothetical protein